MSNWELIIVVGVLSLVISGVSRLALKRRTEILKEYFTPEELPLEQMILRPEKIAARNQEETEQATDDQSPETKETN